MWSIFTKKEFKSGVIAEISDSIKKKYSNVNFDFILQLLEKFHEVINGKMIFINLKA